MEEMQNALEKTMAQRPEIAERSKVQWAEYDELPGKISEAQSDLRKVTPRATSM